MPDYTIGASQGVQVTMRLFIAADLTAQQKKEVSALQRRLSGYLEGIKWVREEGLHLTLKFLGEVDPGRIAALEAALAAAAGEVPPFQMRCGGVGVFPAPGRARVIWAGLQEGAAALTKTANVLERELLRSGFPRSNRPFKPHLTLGRVRDPLPEQVIRRFLEQESSILTSPALIDTLTLYRSNLTPRGALYEPLRKYYLKENAGN